MEIFASVPQIVLNPSNLKDRNTGQPLREQSVLLHATGKLSGIEGKVLLRNDEEPLSIGKYDLSGECFSPARYGSIDFKMQRQHFKPMALQQQKAA